MLAHRKSQPIAPRHFRGFTLVEILAVVVILGIASAIIIPQMGTRDDMRAAAAARTLVADLIYAQNQAITSGRMVYVKFDVANNKYTLLSTAKTGGDVALNNPITQTFYYRPLQHLSYRLDYSLWGLYPDGYHTLNILLHIGNAIPNSKEMLH